jgi:uncharacterized protein (DUF1697 family)
MAHKAEVWIALLRAIGPATHKVMPLAKLCEACSAAGLDEVSSYIATGNLIFRSNMPETSIYKGLTEAIAGFGLTNDVFLRRPKDLEAALRSNAFTDAARERPGKLLICFMARDVSLQGLSGYHGPERVSAVGREVYIDYVNGVGTSKLAPGILERKLSQRGTSRNWNTVQKLAELGKALEAT